MYSDIEKINLKKNFEKIINSLNINLSLKLYILFDNNIRHNEKINQSSIWKDFFKKVELEFKDKTFYKTIVFEINNTLYRDYNIIFYKKNEWIIKINDFLKKIYQRVRNKIYGDNNSLKNIINKLLEILCENFCVIKITETIRRKNYLNHWCLKFSDEEIACFRVFKNNSLYFNEKPLKWIYLQNNDVSLSGDFIKVNITTLDRYIEDKHIKCLFTEQLIDYINILQNTQYKIDKKLFIDLFSKISLSKFYEKNEERIIIEDYEEFLINNKENYIFNGNEQQFLKSVDKMTSLQNINIQKNKWKDLISESDKDVLNFIYNYDGESWLSNNLFMDYRGRLYILGNISYIGSKLLRSLLILQGNTEIHRNTFYKYYIACQIDKPNNLIEGEIIYDNRSKYNTIDNINYNKLEIYNNGFISLDATSSMMQIIGMLTKNEKLCRYTNMTVSGNRYDIYDYMISIVIKERKHDNFDNFINYFNNKKIYKYSVMLYVYGSTPLYTAKSFLELNKNYSIHIKDLTNIIGIIVNTFKIEFQCIVILKKFIKTYADLIKYETFYEFRTLLKKIEYSCPKEKSVHIRYKDINTSFFIESDKLSYEKKMRSSFVNIIHSLDSEVCILTRISLLKELEVQSLSVHDCFLVHINNYEKCVEYYNKSMFQIFDLNIDLLINDIYIKDNFIDTWKNKYYNYINDNDEFLKDIVKKINIKDNSIKYKNFNLGTLALMRQDVSLIEKIKKHIDAFIIKNYENYKEYSIKLKEFQDFKKSDFDSKKIIYSLKPE